MYTRKSSSSLFLAISLAILTLTAPSAFLLLSRLENDYEIFVNMYTALAALCSAFMSLQVVQRLKKSPPSVVRPWILITTGLVLWALAEGIWFYYILVFGEAPAISVCDFFWLFGYLPLTVGLWRIASPFLRELKSMGYATWRNTGVFLLAFVYTLVFFLGLERTISIERSQELQVFVIETSYVLLDALLIVVSLLVARVFKGGSAGHALSIAAGGFLLLAFADLLYTLMGTSEFVPADIMYALSYGVIAIGIWAYLNNVIQRPP